MDGINEDYVKELTYLGVVCDNGCGHGVTADFVVSFGTAEAARTEMIYRYAEKQGWRVYREKSLTYCPDCDDLMMSVSDLARGDELP